MKVPFSSERKHSKLFIMISVINHVLMLKNETHLVPSPASSPAQKTSWILCREHLSGFAGYCIYISPFSRFFWSQLQTFLIFGTFELPKLHDFMATSSIYYII